MLKSHVNITEVVWKFWYLLFSDGLSCWCLAHIFPSIFVLTGTCVDAYGPDGGGEPTQNICKRTHISHQLHFNK